MVFEGWKLQYPNTTAIILGSDVEFLSLYLSIDNNALFPRWNQHNLHSNWKNAIQSYSVWKLMVSDNCSLTSMCHHIYDWNIVTYGINHQWNKRQKVNIWIIFRQNKSCGWPVRHFRRRRFTTGQPARNVGWPSPWRGRYGRRGGRHAGVTVSWVDPAYLTMYLHRKQK